MKFSLFSELETGILLGKSGKAKLHILPSNLYWYWTYPSLWRALQRILSLRLFTSTSSSFNSHKEKIQAVKICIFLKEIFTLSCRLYQRIKILQFLNIVFKHMLFQQMTWPDRWLNQWLFFSIWKHGSDFQHHHTTAEDQLPPFEKRHFLKDMSKHQFVNHCILGKFYFNTC